MEALFSIIREEMRKRRITEYHIAPVLIEVTASNTYDIEGQNDFHFFVTAFSDSIPDGRIRGTGGGKSLDINPTNLNTLLFKYQSFTGAVSIQNNDSSNSLFVEFVRVTPVFERTVEDQ